MRYLRNKADGFIFEWGEILAQNPDVEEVTEEEAFPERFIPAAAKGRKARVSLETKIDEPPDNTPPELSTEVTDSFERALKGNPK